MDRIPEMLEAAPYNVILVDGPMDGDNLMLVPSFSVAPPKALCYPYLLDGIYGYLSYTCEDAFINKGWSGGKEPVDIKYEYEGFFGYDDEIEFEIELEPEE